MEDPGTLLRGACLEASAGSARSDVTSDTAHVSASHEYLVPE